MIQSPKLWLQPFRLVRTLCSAWQTGGDHLWMQRLRRVFTIDRRFCPRCGAQLHLLAVITNPRLTATILEHRNRQASRDPPAASNPLA